MTPQEEFLDRHRHELAGIVLDGVSVNRSGAELALWMRTVMRKIDARLLVIYQEFQPKPEVPPTVNGPPKPPLKGNRP